MIRKTLPVLTTFALVGTAAVVAGAPATAVAPSSTVQLATTPTPFALSASGYSTRVVGGGVPVGSDRTAYQVIGCTNLAGLHKQNAEAEANLGGLRISGCSHGRSYHEEGQHSFVLGAEPHCQGGPRRQHAGPRHVGRRSVNVESLAQRHRLPCLD
ncbi:MAG: hypothetical protein WKF73_21880 [Nocardioidaceae bacterium]